MVFPSLLHFLLGDACGEPHEVVLLLLLLLLVFVMVSLHSWHSLEVVFRNMVPSHFKHVEAPSVSVKNPAWHCVHVVGVGLLLLLLLLSKNALNESNGHA